MAKIQTNHRPRKRNGRNGNGHRTPVQIDGRTIRGLSNGDVHERDAVAARFVRGDADPIKLNVAQAAALVCGTVAGVYDALRQLPAR